MAKNKGNKIGIDFSKGTQDLTSLLITFMYHKKNFFFFRLTKMSFGFETFVSKCAIINVGRTFDGNSIRYPELGKKLTKSRL